MATDPVTGLLPALTRTRKRSFNLFDVMRHGTHEKHSNVFAWLLDTEGSHGLGGRFQRIFLDAINSDAINASGAEPLDVSVPHAGRQDVDAAPAEQREDVADLVFESAAFSFIEQPSAYSGTKEE